MDIQKILSACDHTLLLQPSTWEEIKGICDDARKYRTASICIPPCYVKKAKEYVGTQTALWGITAGVYLATMGPAGMEEVGNIIMANAQYAASRLATVPGVKVDPFGSVFFKEFVVDFSDTGKTVAEINKALLSRGIFGGKDISGEFPALGQAALYCVTEIHTREDIDELVLALKKIVA